MTFAEAINTACVETEVRRALNGINESYQSDAGVVNPWNQNSPPAFVAHPLRLVVISLKNNEVGTLVVDGPWGRNSVEFSADDDINEFCKMNLLEEVVW